MGEDTPGVGARLTRPTGTGSGALHELLTVPIFCGPIQTVAVRESQARTRERTSVGLTGLVR